MELEHTDEGFADLQEALQLVDSQFGANDIRTQTFVHNLGYALILHEPRRAVQLLARAHQLLLTKYPKDHSKAVKGLIVLGIAQRESRDLAAARETLQDCMRQATQIKSEALLGYAMFHYAQTLTAPGQRKEQIALLSESFALRTRTNAAKGDLEVHARMLTEAKAATVARKP